MKKMSMIAAAVVAAASPVMAADTAKAGAFKAGDWMVRGRALGVVADESSSMNIADTVKVGNATVPELDVSYFLTPNVALELIAAVTPHNISTKGGVDAGNVWLLPPTLTLQYHFTQLQGVKPYVGAGINYTHFFNDDAGSLGDAHYEDSFGGALQAGVDVPVGGNWYANVDVKKVFINTDAKFSAGAVRADVDIDPWIIGAGVGYKF